MIGCFGVAVVAFLALALYSVERYLNSARPISTYRPPDFDAVPLSTTTSEEADATPRATERPVRSDADLQLSRFNGGCEAAADAYRKECDGQPESCRDPVPSTKKANFQKALNRGTYLNGCGVPPTMTINICAGIRHGKAVAVTVRTEPFDDAKGQCIAKAVTGLSFPSSNYLRIARTKFAGETAP